MTTKKAAKAKKTTTASKATTKPKDEEVGKVTPLDPTQGLKSKSEAKGKAKVVDERPRLDLTKLKPGDKVVMLAGSRGEWLKVGMVGEFRSVERNTLARVKFEKGTTLVGSRNLKRA